MAQLRQAYLASMTVLANAIDIRDPYTGGHVERVTDYSTAIGERLGFSEQELEHLRYGAILHDIGKIGVPDFILMKPASLSKYEYEIIKEHTIKGFLIMRPYIKTLPDIVTSIMFHHETFSGNGYPLHLFKDEIPLFPRIIAVADAFDAMVTGHARQCG